MERETYARAHEIRKYVKYQSFNLGIEKKGKQVNEGKACFFALCREIGSLSTHIPVRR